MNATLRAPIRPCTWVRCPERRASSATSIVAPISNRMLVDKPCDVPADFSAADVRRAEVKSGPDARVDHFGDALAELRPRPREPRVGRAGDRECPPRIV